MITGIRKASVRFLLAYISKLSKYAGWRSGLACSRRIPQVGDLRSGPHPDREPPSRGARWREVTAQAGLADQGYAD
jgi:hypothetical protein